MFFFEIPQSKNVSLILLLTGILDGGVVYATDSIQFCLRWFWTFPRGHRCSARKFATWWLSKAASKLHWLKIRPRWLQLKHMCIYIYIYIRYTCVCLCVPVLYILTYFWHYTYIYIYLHITPPCRQVYGPWMLWRDFGTAHSDTWIQRGGTH